MTVAEDLTARLARRLATSVTGTASFPVRAAHEYRPRQLARALVERIDARHLDMTLAEAAADTSWVDELDADTSLLLDWDGASDPAEPLMAVLAAARRPGVAPVLLVVCEADAPAGPVVRTARSAWSRQFERDAADALTRVCRGWAERVHDAVAADDLALLDLFLPPMNGPDIATVATAALGREVPLEEVLELPGRVPAVTGSVTGSAAFPPALAAQIIQVSMTRDPSRTVSLRRDLSTVLTDQDLDIIARDRALDFCAPFVALLSTTELASLTAFLPHEVPLAWHSLHEIQDYAAHLDRATRLLPEPWLRLLFTTTIGNDALFTPRLVEVRDRLMLATSRVQVPSTDQVSADLGEALGWLDECFRDLNEEAARSFRLRRAFKDEAHLLCLGMMGAADACLALTRLSDAQACLNKAHMLVEALTTDVREAPALLTGLPARDALMAAYAGMHERSETFLEEYEMCAARGGVREPEPEHVVEIARRFSAGAAPYPVRASADLPANTQFTPLEVQAEAELILAQRGPQAAVEWLLTLLSRSQWTDLMPFMWWPDLAMLALLDLREGRADDALARVQGAYLPQEVRLLIDAGAALVRGDAEDCLEAVRGLVAARSVSPRVTLIGYGYRVGAMAALGDPDLDGEVAAHATGWAANPALVAVLPETARARVLPVLEPAVAGKQGLRLSGGPAAAAVVLTPRQTDVLERLASERTLADIADELFLGVETVRSTSKAVYKKLGVHSREEAVRTARLSGLLVPGEHDETAGQR
ncbi:hypothetical protein AXF14_04480 [Actinomyces radicidentis]|uniref:HTH luxR-type domain-containing protein n=1 Tax=Actinomyces radicidentis TaxID=111015 RepID=A0A109W2D8_ACTRD|nr:helix-turn-helix transcriptional regulator [Actinomyces radicidentis]AMD86990.1 hypothetical protein AXF14_04480 [Actinomyces radicidentis]